MLLVDCTTKSAYSAVLAVPVSLRHCSDCSAMLRRHCARCSSIASYAAMPSRAAIADKISRCVRANSCRMSLLGVPGIIDGGPHKITARLGTTILPEARAIAAWKEVFSFAKSSPASSFFSHASHNCISSAICSGVLFPAASDAKRKKKKNPWLNQKPQLKQISCNADTII